MHIHSRKGSRRLVFKKPVERSQNKTLHFCRAPASCPPGRGRGWRGCSSAQGGQGRVGAAAHLRVAPVGVTCAVQWTHLPGARPQRLILLLLVLLVLLALLLLLLLLLTVDAGRRTGTRAPSTTGAHQCRQLISSPSVWHGPRDASLCAPRRSARPHRARRRRRASLRAHRQGSRLPKDGGAIPVCPFATAADIGDARRRFLKVGRAPVAATARRGASIVPLACMHDQSIGAIVHRCYPFHCAHLHGVLVPGCAPAPLHPALPRAPGYALSPCHATSPIFSSHYRDLGI